MKTKEKRRWLRFQYDDDSYIDIMITKCTVIKKELDKVAFHVDKIGDDQFLMIANEKLLPDGKKLDKIQIIREEDIDAYDAIGIM